MIYVYDGWKAVLEHAFDGVWFAYNVYGPGSDEILWRYHSQVGHLRYHTDIHGNVTELLGWSGEQLEKYTYDAFGIPTVTNWDGSNSRSYSAYGNRFLFQGREWYSELGYYNFRYRFYDPTVGRFLQPDPLGFGGGDANLFRYCGGDPINRRDAYGLASPDPTKKKDGNDYGGAPDVSIDGADLDPGDADHDTNVPVAGADSNGSTGTVDVHVGSTGSGQPGKGGVRGGLNNAATGLRAGPSGHGNSSRDGGGNGRAKGDPAGPSSSGNPAGSPRGTIPNPYKDSGPLIADVWRDFDGKSLTETAHFFEKAAWAPVVAVALPVAGPLALDGIYVVGWQGLVPAANAGMYALYRYPNVLIPVQQVISGFTSPGWDYGSNAGFAGSLTNAAFNEALARTGHPQIGP